MKIEIVNYEEAFGNSGILTKYSKKMNEELLSLGYDSFITSRPSGKADVTHHVNYIAYQKTNTIDTLMITHLTGDTNRSRECKLNILKEAIKTSFGITFEPQRLEYLVECGIPRDKLDFVFPAHDSISRRPRVVAILTNIYPDKRKREWMCEELFKVIDKDKFIFKIMGSGWENINFYGINKELYPQFEMEKYKEILWTADYNLYTGDEDCQAQSAVDANYAGIRNILPKMDTFDNIGIDYPFETQEELNKIFKSIETTTTENWNWENYVKKHCKIWEKLYLERRMK